MTEWRVGIPMAVNGLTLVPIERVVVEGDEKPNSFWFHASKEPVALVVCGLGPPYALNLGPPALSVEDLSRQVRGLESVLRSLVLPNSQG